MHGATIGKIFFIIFSGRTSVMALLDPNDLIYDSIVSLEASANSENLHW